MHPLVHAVGPDAVAMRVPSASAVALTAAAIYVLARQCDSPATAAAASVVFVGLARTSWMATEARSFALATLVATLLSLMLIRAIRARPGKGSAWIVAYAALATVGVYLYVYLALVVAAHAMTVLLVRLERRRSLSILAAMATAAVISVPLLVLAVTQRGQLGGTFPIGIGTWSHVFVSQLFHRQHAQAALAWTVLVVAGIVWLWRWRCRTHRSVPSHSVPLVVPLLALLGPWLTLPTLIIVAFSSISPTIYQPRALVISAPAFCILFAVALRRAFGSPSALAGALLVLVLGLPAYVANREVTAKGSDWPVVAEHLASHAARRDGILYSVPIDYHSWPSLIRIMHPDAVGGLNDIAMTSPYRDRPALFDERADIAATVDRLESLDRVWYVRSDRLNDVQSHSHVGTMESSGLVLVSTWSGPKTTVEEWVRAGR